MDELGTNLFLRDSLFLFFLQIAVPRGEEKGGGDGGGTQE